MSATTARRDLAPWEPTAREEAASDERVCADPCCGQTIPTDRRAAYCSWACRNNDDLNE